MPNKAPVPNRRPRFTFAMFGDVEYCLCAPPSSSAAVGEEQRSVYAVTMKMPSIVLILLGALLLAAAWHSAREIPLKARADFLEYAKTNPLNDPGFPEAFMQMQTHRRLLQNFYLGAAGLVLLAVGARGFCNPRGSTGDKKT